MKCRLCVLQDNVQGNFHFWEQARASVPKKEKKKRKKKVKVLQYTKIIIILVKRLDIVAKCCLNWFYILYFPWHPLFLC